MKGVKLLGAILFAGIMFESLVSFEGCKTKRTQFPNYIQFESLVSFEGCKTKERECPAYLEFESLVSFEGCKTAGKD